MRRLGIVADRPARRLRFEEFKGGVQRESEDEGEVEEHAHKKVRVPDDVVHGKDDGYDGALGLEEDCPGPRDLE